MPSHTCSSKLEKPNMETRTIKVTTISSAEIKDLLREPMAACGYDVNTLHFPDRGEIIKVASTFDLDSDWDGTLEDVIKDNPPTTRAIYNYLAGLYLACLTCTVRYGNGAIPKTDYIISG